MNNKVTLRHNSHNQSTIISNGTNAERIPIIYNIWNCKVMKKLLCVLYVKKDVSKWEKNLIEENKIVSKIAEKLKQLDDMICQNKFLDKREIFFGFYGCYQGSCQVLKLNVIQLKLQKQHLNGYFDRYAL